MVIDLFTKHARRENPNNGRDHRIREGIMSSKLTHMDEGGNATGRQVMLFTTALVPISLAPALFGTAGNLYLVGAFVLGLTFLTVGLRMAWTRTVSSARSLLLASVVYLPLLLGLLVADRVRLDILR